MEVYYVFLKFSGSALSYASSVSNEINPPIGSLTLIPIPVCQVQTASLTVVSTCFKVSRFLQEGTNYTHVTLALKAFLTSELDSKCK